MDCDIRGDTRAQPQRETPITLTAALDIAVQEMRVQPRANA